jgi:hypothetical protein
MNPGCGKTRNAMTFRIDRVTTFFRQQLRYNPVRSIRSTHQQLAADPEYDAVAPVTRTILSFRHMLISEITAQQLKITPAHYFEYHLETLPQLISPTLQELDRQHMLPSHQFGPYSHAPFPQFVQYR